MYQQNTHPVLPRKASFPSLLIAHFLSVCFSCSAAKIQVPLLFQHVQDLILRLRPHITLHGLSVLEYHQGRD